MNLVDVDADSAAGARDTPESVPGSVLARRRRVRDLLRLDSAFATVVFWTSLALMAASMFVPRVLPCIDYPQHLALSEIIRRLAHESAPEHAQYYVNMFTYNGLFHLLCGWLGHFIPIDLAGRLLVSLSVFVLGVAALALVNITRRPPLYALAFIPLLFSFSLNWGFVNYALGVATGVLALVVMVHSTERPSVGAALWTGALGMVCAVTHVLAMLVLCLFAAALVPEIAWRVCRSPGQGKGMHIRRVFARTVVVLSPLLVGCAYCIAVYIQQYQWNPGVYHDATMEGTGPAIWKKLLYFSGYASGLHRDGTDQFLLWGSLAVLLAACVLRAFGRGKRRDSTAPGGHAESGAGDSEGDGDRPVVLPALVFLAAYLLTPMVFIGTHLIFPRLAQGFMLGAILAAPRFPARLFGHARTVLMTLAGCTALNFFVHTVVYAIETDDLYRVIDEAPAGRRATAVVYRTDTFSFRQETLIHSAGYYAVRKGGDWAFSFARFLSVPVRFRKAANPPWPLRGWEFTPGDYNPRCNYARAFNLVFVRAPRYLPHDASVEPTVRRLVFGQDADKVKLVSHHGAFWAFDTEDVPHDGTL